MSVSVIRSRDCDVKDVLSRSSVADVPNAEQILQRWLRTSEEVWFGMHDERVACVWGLAPPTAISNRAYLWLLTTDLVEQHKFIFIRHSQIAVEGALKRYEMIIGHVAVGNQSARKWLRWLGASIAPPENGMSPFVIKR